MALHHTRFSARDVYGSVDTRITDRSVDFGRERFERSGVEAHVQIDVLPPEQQAEPCRKPAFRPADLERLVRRFVIEHVSLQGLGVGHPGVD